jgi:SAM-dependent methyltransferase
VRRRRRPSPAERHALVGPADRWEEKRAFQFDFLLAHGLAPHHRFLDVGCGTLRGGLPVIAYLETGHYVGLDVREHVLDEARKELVENGLAGKRPTLMTSHDFAGLEAPMPVDIAWAFSVLIHMTDDIATQCLAFIARSLAEGGVFYANVKVGDRRDRETGREGFHVVTRQLEFYTSIAAGLRMEDLGTLASLGHRMGLTGDRHHMLRFSV